MKSVVITTCMTVKAANSSTTEVIASATDGGPANSISAIRESAAVELAAIQRKAPARDTLASARLTAGPTTMKPAAFARPTTSAISLSATPRSTSRGCIKVKDRPLAKERGRATARIRRVSGRRSSSASEARLAP